MTLNLHQKVHHQLLDFLNYFIYRRDFASALKVYQTLVPLYHAYSDTVLLPSILGLLRRAAEAYDDGQAELAAADDSKEDESDSDNTDDKEAAERRSNAFMRFIQQLFAVDRHHRKELLLELICHHIKLKRYQEGYDYLVNYLSLRSFAGEPIFHGMAGLLASFLFYSGTATSLSEPERIDWDNLPASHRWRGLLLKALKHFKRYFELPVNESRLGGAQHQLLFRYYRDRLLLSFSSIQDEADPPVVKKRKIKFKR